MIENQAGEQAMGAVPATTAIDAAALAAAAQARPVFVSKKMRAAERIFLWFSRIIIRFAMVIVFLGGGIAFNTWLFKGYVDSLPRDLEESAYVDGASRFQAYWKIILPLTRPMMAVIFLFQFIGVYNDYILTSFLITDPNKYTV